MPRRRPEFELGVAGGSNLQQVVVAAVVQFDAAHDLRVTAIEALGEPQHRRQRADGAARPALQIAEAVVAALGRRLAVVARDQRNLLDLVGLEAAQIAVANQVVRVFVMALIADLHADVVQDRRVLEPLALLVGHAVDGARLIEQRHGELRHLLRVFGPVVAALGQFEHAAPPDVGIAVGLRDFFAVPRDVVQHQTLAQRHVAECDVGRAEPPDNFVQQNRPGDGEVGASRLEAGHP